MEITIKNETRGWGFSSVVKCLPSKPKALGSVLSSGKKKKEKKKNKKKKIKKKIKNETSLIFQKMKQSKKKKTF
jgi:hypothetical protein